MTRLPQPTLILPNMTCRIFLQGLAAGGIVLGLSIFFDVRIADLKMTVAQADGRNVEPVTADEIRIGVAETYDVIVTSGDETYTIYAQLMDRTGYALATLATRAGLTAVVLELDKPEQLTMTDMMGDMGGMSGMSGMNALQPRMKTNVYGKSDPARELGNGLSDLATGIRLRYEIRREFTPYIGIEWARKFCEIEDLVLDSGQVVNEVRGVAGERFWF